MLPPPHLYIMINPIAKRMHPIHCFYKTQQTIMQRWGKDFLPFLCPLAPGVVLLSPASPCFFLKGLAPLNIALGGAAKSQWLTSAGVYLAQHWTWPQLSPELLCGTESVARCGAGGHCLRLLTGLPPSPVSLPYLFFVGALPSESILHRSHRRLCFWETHSVWLSWFSSLLMDI